MRSIAGVPLIVAILVLFSPPEKVSAKSEDGNIVVKTSLGDIRGVTLKSRLGESFSAFRGIRYANPPTGQLRFQPPEPVNPWSGVYDATKDGPQCPQPKINNEIVESEDCLRLNIYSRQVTKNDNLKPVLFFIHPGGFYAFSGLSAMFGPEYLMDHDVVLVTINYRLGSLGYLSTGTADSPGNAGFKDQVVALKFIRDHISAFGGDPNSVTAFGYSAGALSITLHMVSPMSRGLFHKAIVMSASAIGQWSPPEHQLELAQKQARLFNCTTETPKALVDCLRKADAIDMGNKLSEMFELGSQNPLMPVLLWKPVIEPDFGQERFLVEDPTISYLEGRYMKIPVIAGITKDEFVQFAHGILTNDNLKYEFDARFNELAPIAFLYERNSERSKKISQTLRKYYVNFPLISESRIPQLGELFSDSSIGFSVHRFTQLASRHTKVFYYKNTFHGRYSFFYYPEGKPYGVVHHDDLLYLFGVPLLAPTFAQNDPENLNVERMTRLWTTFAGKGNPNNPNDEYLSSAQWTPYSSLLDNYLEIGNGDNFTMREGLYSDRFRVWDELFPLPLTNKTSHL
ncbi:juvenile hormone esterase [Phlebotomus argentipes]|uniref:juvenile hormone esterase n=1 Tax=Phlebotomus argentipes TaxID=94469 RepID=UPI0028935DC8|nr:juvenile hormone esterase [Phlebotomus argentipes]